MNQRKNRKKFICIIGIAFILAVGIFLGYKLRLGGGRRASESAQKEIKELILGTEEEKDDEIIVDQIRDYIYTQMEWAFAEEFHTDVVNQIFSDDLPWEKKIYELCEPDTIESAGYCGGTAYVLSVAYNMLGYKSCTLDMVVFDESGSVVSSHVVTLVCVEGKWIIEDASYNLTFRKNGEHISIQELIQSVCNNNTNEIEIVYGENKWRKGVFLKPEYEGEYTLLEPEKFIES